MSWYIPYLILNVPVEYFFYLRFCTYFLIEWNGWKDVPWLEWSRSQRFFKFLQSAEGSTEVCGRAGKIPSLICKFGLPNHFEWHNHHACNIDTNI